MRLSVVVASFGGEEALRRCLESLAPQEQIGEIVVASADPSSAALAAGFRAARFTPAPAEASVFELRSRGVAAARGDHIALTEDHCVARPDWARALLEAHAAGHAVVGGPVDAGGGLGFCGRALHLCEYADHLPPLRDGAAGALSGVNVCYARPALARCRDVWAEAFYENEVHDALREAGVPLHRASRAIVAANLAFPLGDAMSHLRRGGLRFGLYRINRTPPGRRLLLRALAPLVPVVLLARLLRIVAFRRPSWLALALVALPYEACLLGAWSFGEMAGTWGTTSAARER